MLRKGWTEGTEKALLTFVERIRNEDVLGSTGPYRVTLLTTRLFPGRNRSRWSCCSSKTTLDRSLSALRDPQR